MVYNIFERRYKSLNNRIYLCIDLKSFYASVECLERGLDPLDTNLVVADSSRTEKTICLAVSPSLKTYGIPGRPRLFEVVQKVKNANDIRIKYAPNRAFSGTSYNYTELENNKSLKIDYIIAPPQMAYYMQYSTRVYNIYLKYVAPEDIHVYSIDEVFMDVTEYIKRDRVSPYEFAMKIIYDVLKSTGVTATAGIGTNMYLAKVAMDIVAKKKSADKYGVRIAELDEKSYRTELWSHTPITDFWRVGRGYASKLEKIGLYTMGDIAECSLNEYGEDKLYKLFGVNAELLIDHAWGWEPCTIDDIRKYKPENKSICSGQVLHCPYDFDKAKLIVREMLELLSLDLVEKRVVTDQIVLTIGYDIENIKNSKINYNGEITTDRYGRKVPKHAHGTANIGTHTSSAMLMIKTVMKLYDEIVDPKLLIRRVNISTNHILSEYDPDIPRKYEQLDLLTDYDKLEKERKKEEKERAVQEATIKIRNKFGKNAILKGINLKEGATAKERNNQIGGHKA
ncbi:MAG: DNA methylase [Clostridiales bacterium]|nr:DNA methylase [Clostridiales bacterium]